MQSDSAGNYRFERLSTGDYRVQIGRWEAFYGQALTGLRSSTGNGRLPPIQTTIRIVMTMVSSSSIRAPIPRGGGLVTRPGSSPWPTGTEPDVLVDGDGIDSNMTLDLGLHPSPGRHSS